MDPLALDIIVTILAGILFLVGLTGIVVPVLPGSITILVTMLVWAIVVGGWPSWVAFGIVTVLSIAGMTCSYVLTGRRLKKAEVPNWPIVVGIVAGIVGIFVIPVLGLPIGFMLGLYGSEWYRRRDPKLAWESSWIALKSLGIGILVELGLGFLSTLAFAVAAAVHFLPL